MPIRYRVDFDALEAEKKNDNVTKDNDNVLSHAKINYIDEATRQTHLNYIAAFKEHPNTRPQDIVSAEMSQAAYIDHIKNPDIMEDFVNRVSSLKEQGWKLHPDSKTHNEYTKTFVHAETGKVAVAYRGTQTWIGQDGRANISNTLGITKVRQSIHDQFDVDLRTKKAKIIHDTNTYIKENYGEKVTITTGHSQGSRDSTQAKRTFFPEAESIVFQPAPGGEVKQHEGRMFTTPNDGVSLKGKALAAVHPDYDMNYTRSTDRSKLNTLTGGHMLDNQSVSVPNVVGEDMSVRPVIHHAKITHFKHFGRGAATGLLPGIAASLIVENLPDSVVCMF